MLLSRSLVWTCLWVSFGFIHFYGIYGRDSWAPIETQDCAAKSKTKVRKSTTESNMNCVSLKMKLKTLRMRFQWLQRGQEEHRRGTLFAAIEWHKALGEIVDAAHRQTHWSKWKIAFTKVQQLETWGEDAASIFFLDLDNPMPLTAPASLRKCDMCARCLLCHLIRFCFSLAKVNKSGKAHSGLGQKLSSYKRVQTPGLPNSSRSRRQDAKERQEERTFVMSARISVAILWLIVARLEGNTAAGNSGER